MIVTKNYKKDEAIKSKYIIKNKEQETRDLIFSYLHELKGM